VNELLHHPAALAMALLGAVCVGLAKSGFTGISLVSVFLFADLFGAKTSVGLVLPLLIIADLTVYPAFREHGSWKPVWKLLPPALCGLAAGYWVLTVINDKQASHGIGLSVLVMAAVQSLRSWKPRAFDEMAHSRGFGIAAGVTGGMATMIANAAGPVIQLYLLSKRIPKMELIGISARFFLLINLLKLPMNFQLDLINRESLQLNLMLVPAVWLGIFSGRYFVKKVPQRIFEMLVIVFSVLAGVRLCFF
jgi:uncharacterized membrane protein YfcA